MGRTEGWGRRWQRTGRGPRGWEVPSAPWAARGANPSAAVHTKGARQESGAQGMPVPKCPTQDPRGLDAGAHPTPGPGWGAA